MNVQISRFRGVFLFQCVALMYSRREAYEENSSYSNSCSEFACGKFYVCCNLTWPKIVYKVSEHLKGLELPRKCQSYVNRKLPSCKIMLNPVVV